MCCRYYIDDGIVAECTDLLTTSSSENINMASHDIHPGDIAPIIKKSQSGLTLDEVKWGFPQYSGKGLFINARSETALEKKSFRESVRYRRCVIPARLFYEWPKLQDKSGNGRSERRDFSKSKVCFLREDGAALYMAGLYNLLQDEVRFVILTTQANPPVSPVHDRMPLILEKEEVRDWICDDSEMGEYLKKIPLPLQRQQEYEQQSLFDIL